MTKAIVDRNKENYITTLSSYSEELVNKGEQSLEVLITSQIAEGATIIDICKHLNFPAVHILAWLQKEHPDLLTAAENIQKDKAYDNLSTETETYDDLNYKHRKAGADIKLNVLKARQLAKKDEQKVVGGGGMNFAINVVVPDYAKQEDEEVTTVEVIEDDS